jgi:hypothetical protein
MMSGQSLGTLKQKDVFLPQKYINQITKLICNTDYLIPSFLPPSIIALVMGAASTSEMSVNFYQTTTTQKNVIFRNFII